MKNSTDALAAGYRNARAGYMYAIAEAKQLERLAYLGASKQFLEERRMELLDAMRRLDATKASLDKTRLLMARAPSDWLEEAGSPKTPADWLRKQKALLTI